MQTVKILTSQNVSIDYELASLGDRMLGRIIDVGIFVIVYILFLIGLRSALGVSIPLVMGIYSILVVCYDIICEIFFNGQTIGKKMMSIRVISLDGARPSVGQYLLRWVFRLIDFTLSFQLAGLISVAVTEKKQRIGDIVAGTVLVKTDSQIAFQSLSFQPTSDDYIPKYNEVMQLNDQDIRLINEVLDNYSKSGNAVLLHNMAEKIREHLNIPADSSSTDYKFLKKIVKDYSHIASKAEFQ